MRELLIFTGREDSSGPNSQNWMLVRSGRAIGGHRGQVSLHHHHWHLGPDTPYCRGGGGACRVRGKVLSSFSGLCPIDTSSTSPVMIAKNVSRYCLIKTSSVEYHWSGAIPVPHLADRKLSPAEGDKPSQSYSYSASAGVETRTQDPHGSHTQGQRAALLSFADCSVGFCFYFCFSSSSMSDPSISCFHFIVPFLSFCFSYCITEINPSLGNREVQKEGDKEHSAAPR